MIKAVIIEDEPKASELLRRMLTKADPDIAIQAILSNVDEGIHYLSSNEKVDLIFCDVQLPDGLSFAIFEALNINVPIVFITGYDQYLLHAFESNGIDYLLKPVRADDLDKALKKFRSLQQHFASSSNELSLQNLVQQLSGRHKTRIVVKKGIESISLLLSDVMYFYTENKIVHAFDKNCKKYLVDKNLSDLEEELDRQQFFRANRQYLLNIDYIKSFKPYERVKLWVELTCATSQPVIVSQETAPVFKKWLLES